MTLKAYIVREDDEGHCAIVFANNSATARREGGNELNLSFEEVESCRREPRLDQYAPGPVDPAILIREFGWWYECSGCGTRVGDDDGEAWIDDEGFEHEREFISDGKRRVWCCQACCSREDAKTRMRKACDAAMVELVLSKYPETIKVDHVYTSHEPGAYWAIDDWEARFSLPGLQGDVSWKLKEPGNAWVWQQDAEFFKAHYSTAK